MVALRAVAVRRELRSRAAWSFFPPTYSKSKWSRTHGGLGKWPCIAALFSCALLAACGGTTNSSSNTPTLVSIAVTPANLSIAKGTTQQFMATGTYSDSSTQDLTSTATWSSTSTNVATINATGLASGVVAGSTTITAMSGSISGSTTLTVTPVFVPTGSLTSARDGATATLLNNGMVLIVGGCNEAVPTFCANLLASAELYNPATGTFSTTGNLNTAREAATATLLNNGMVLVADGCIAEAATACAGPLASAELYAPATLTPPNLVSISVTPVAPTLSAGGTQKFVATGTFSDNSTEQLASVTWSSSSTAVAQISNDATNSGTAIAIAAGTTTITATDGTVSGTATLTVN